MKVLHQKMKEAEAILLGSPTYFDNVSGRMKTFFDRCLPFYFSGELEDKKVGLVTSGGFRNLVERDDNQECIWCKDGKKCERTVKRCINSMKYFCEHLGMDVIGSVYSIHGEPEKKDNELGDLGMLFK
jgi:multimeric flavodoxin WrbA